jgi:hypothetical protein
VACSSLVGRVGLGDYASDSGVSLNARGSFTFDPDKPIAKAGVKQSDIDKGARVADACGGLVKGTSSDDCFNTVAGTIAGYAATLGPEGEAFAVAVIAIMYLGRAFAQALFALFPEHATTTLPQWQGSPRASWNDQMVPRGGGWGSHCAFGGYAPGNTFERFYEAMLWGVVQHQHDHPAAWGQSARLPTYGERVVLLASAIKMWNQAHDASAVRVITRDFVYAAASPPWGAGFGPADPCDPIARSLPAPDPADAGHDTSVGFTVNMGPAPVTLTPTVLTPQGAAPATSTARKLVVGTAVVGGAAVGTVALVAWAKGKTFGWVLDKIWDSLQGRRKGRA